MGLLNFKKGNFSLIIGEIYHIKNGYAKTLDELWINNAVLENIEQENDSVELLIFRLEDGSLLNIDADFMCLFNKNNTEKGYQFIGNYNSLN